MTQHIVNISGGKDSTACYLLALQRGATFRAVMADTGNEHPVTIDYAERLAERTGLRNGRARTAAGASSTCSISLSARTRGSRTPPSMGFANDRGACCDHGMPRGRPGMSDKQAPAAQRLLRSKAP